jgi:hypothetical protein
MDVKRYPVGVFLVDIVFKRIFLQFMQLIRPDLDQVGNCGLFQC